MTIAENILKFKESIPSHVRLVAISKFNSAEAVREAYDTGHRIFGESRQQEVVLKQQELPDDIEWHFVGPLQRNKVRAILPYTHTIHSVDSVRLFNTIARHAGELKKEVRCLLQIHIADEASKQGFAMDECRQFLDTGEWKDSKYAYIGGVMGMSTHTDDEGQVSAELEGLKSFFDELKDTYFAQSDRFVELSMGMSDDYKIAIEAGSTLIRVGTAIFGEREY